MAPFRSFARPSSAAIAVLIFAGCSFQNFDYLKGEYKSAGGSGGGAGRSEGGAGGAVASGGVGGSSIGASGSAAADNASGASQGGEAGDSAGMAGDANSSGEAGEGGAPPVPPGMLLNPSFELGSATTVTDWTNTGDTAAAFVDFTQARTGSGRLGHWLMSGSYAVSTSQLVQPIPNGKYTFSIWVRHDLSLGPNEYIFARGYSQSQPGAEMKQLTTIANDTSYTQIILPHIPVTSGACEVGIYTNGGPDSATNWSVIDDAALTLESP